MLETFRYFTLQGLITLPIGVSLEAVRDALTEALEAHGGLLTDGRLVEQDGDGQELPANEQEM